jgi:hypothetical protein
VEFELDPAVENRPQRQLVGFNRHEPHDLTRYGAPRS